MSSVFYLGVLSCIIIVSIFASGFANHSQQKRLRQRKLVQQLRNSADHFALIAASIAQFSSNKSMAAEFIGMAISNYQRILHLDAESEHTQNSLQNAQQLAQQLGSGTLRNDADAEFNILRVKQQLNDACHIFKKMLNSGTLSGEVYKEYHRELTWLYVNIEVDMLVRQGDEARHKKDKLRSMSYYQNALNLLKRSAIIDPRKQEKINAITDALALKV